MPDIWMDVDAALAEVPVNIFPLIDDTDFKSIEGAVVYNPTGLALRWHFVTCAGAYTVTSVTPTTGGVHDWTDQGDAGIYTIEIPASGGTINNDTEGFGWFTGVATGILPWRGPVIGFRASGLNDLLVESAYSTARGLSGTALPAAAAGAAGGIPTDSTGKTSFNDLSAAQVNAEVDTALNTAIPGSPTADSINQRIAAIDDLTQASGAGDLAAILTDTGTTLDGKLNTIDDFLDTEVAAILADTNELQTDWTNGGRLDLILDIIAADTTTDIPALIDALPTAAEIQAEVEENGASVLDTIRDEVQSATYGLSALKTLIDAITAYFTSNRAEPGQGAPAASTTFLSKLDYLYKSWRNEKRQTSSQWSLYNDTGDTVDQKATVSDDSSTTTKGEIATGP